MSIHVSGDLVTFEAGTVSLDEIEKVTLSETLRACAGNKKAASSVLGISRSALYAKLARFGLMPKPCDSCEGTGHEGSGHNEGATP